MKEYCNTMGRRVWSAIIALTKGDIVQVPKPKSVLPLFSIEYDLNYVLDLGAILFLKNFLPQIQRGKY